MGPSDGKNSTQIEGLKMTIRDFCRDREWDQFHGAKDLAIGLVTEAAELLEIFRFQSPEQCDSLLSDETGRRAVADELADVFFFLLRFSDRFEFDLEEALRGKLKKNAERYPVSEFRGRNHKAKK